MAKRRQDPPRRQMYLPSPTGEVECPDQDEGCCGVFFLKHVLYVFNFILLVSGCAVLAVGLWTLFVKQSFVTLLSSSLFTLTTYLLIGTGAVVIVLVFTLGCVGTCRESCCLLMTFAAFLMLVFMLEAVIGVIAYLYEASLMDDLSRNLNSTILSTHRVNDEKTEAIDEMQQYFRCCGARNYTDWYYRPNSTAELEKAESQYRSCASYAPDEFARGDWVFSAPYDEMSENLAIPESCCLSPCRGCTRRVHPSNIFTSGCITSLEQYISESLIIVGAIGLGLCCLEIFGVVFACCLAKKVKRRRERHRTYWR